MNCWVTKIGLGIIVYLSFSALDSNQSFASSLRFSDRYELNQLNNDSFLSEELSLISNYPTQTRLPELSNPNISNTQETIESESFGFSYTQKPSESTAPEEIAELFSPLTFDIQVQSAVSETEETNLWQSIAESLSNLQFANVEESSNEPNVIILPQTAYEDIYRGIYDFEINLAAIATITPRVANRSIPDVALISQESIGGYGTAFASQALRTSPEDYLNPEGLSNNISSLIADSNSSQSSINLNKLGVSVTDDYYEDLSQRVSSLISNNINVIPRIEDIELESKVKIPSPLSQFQNSKDPKLQSIEEQIEERQEKLKQEREKLREKLEKEQEVRERKRQQDREKRMRERENTRRKQIATQERIKRQQNSSFSTN